MIFNSIGLLLILLINSLIMIRSFTSHFNWLRRTTVRMKAIQAYHQAVARGGDRRATLLGYNSDNVNKAGEMLKTGGLVAFPTETVYGLGANAFNAVAVQSIFNAKGRPNSDPLIVHIADPAMMHDLFDFTSIAGLSEHDLSSAEATRNANKNGKRVCGILATAFWPGPLTLIHKAQPSIPPVVTAGTGYVGVRCPSHPIALALIAAAGVPVAAPSAVSGTVLRMCVV